MTMRGHTDREVGPTPGGGGASRWNSGSAFREVVKGGGRQSLRGMGGSGPRMSVAVTGPGSPPGGSSGPERIVAARTGVRRNGQRRFGVHQTRIWVELALGTKRGKA
uniref:Uncharacterized protein n=1 Tax=Eutreptiella gymnastica TaxID=73025 RepID=A0A7S4GG48_9EUGL|mmetsp:Transcript_105173/g.177684  ORF Transcript_105173/g.177684 Transcript_105173/m.177684 type:complete len:107 (+) Transcript_105173:10-330(+)